MDNRKFLVIIFLEGSNPSTLRSINFGSSIKCADVAEQADAWDLKSHGASAPYRFDSGHRHHIRSTDVQRLAFQSSKLAVRVQIPCVAPYIPV